MVGMKKEIRNTPILVANTHWPLPDNLIKDVKSERMVNALLNMACPDMDYKELVGWAECVAYLMPATSQSVVRKDVAEIYLYCVTQLQKRKGLLEALPTECRVEKLSDYQMQELDKFKKWIFEARGGKESNPIVNAFQEVFFAKKENQPLTGKQLSLNL